MNYIITIICALGAWLLGLLIDVNLDFNSSTGILGLRILFPMIVIGICILKSINDKNKSE